MKIQISRILHAGYLLQSQQARIVFDPIFENPFSRNCYAFPDVKFDKEKIQNLKLDAVFISHFHDDHFSLESLNLLDRRTPIYMFCVFPELFDLIKALGFNEVHEVKLGQQIKVKDFTVLPWKALDEDVDSIYQIQVAGLNILNVVDSWIGPSTFQELKKVTWDLILWPFQTMRELEVLSPNRSSKTVEIPIEWVDQLKVLNSRILIPSSCQFLMEPWSWYNHAFFPISYKYFQEVMQAHLPQTKIQRLDPSQTLILEEESYHFGQPLDWVHAQSEQVDYQYQPDILAPKTGEIAKRFPALSEEKLLRVYQFCEKEILERYRQLEGFDEYFSKPRIWCLRLFDHKGEERNFHYRIQENRIQMIDSQSPSEWGWMTEVPIFKLYGALQEGESMTSLYLRINDILFSDEIEPLIQNVDVLEDPLIRTVFNGDVGAYQKAQLKKIIGQ